jgi:hypothetical protein
MGKNLIFRLFLKLFGYRLSRLSAKTLQNKKLLNIGGLLRKCAYQAYIIFLNDVLILELIMKVQFANF